jgi:hypothetical protein
VTFDKKSQINNENFNVEAAINPINEEREESEE